VYRALIHKAFIGCFLIVGATVAATLFLGSKEAAIYIVFGGSLAILAWVLFLKRHIRTEAEREALKREVFESVYYRIAAWLMLAVVLGKAIQLILD
jgi:hypothetical protein